jgi:hypothetical protein
MVLEVKFGQRPVLGLVFSEVNENLVVEANKAYVNLLKERKELFFQKKKGWLFVSCVMYLSIG